MTSSANASSCPVGSGGYSSPSYADFQEFLFLTTPNFTVAKSGEYIVRYNWHWDWSTLFADNGPNASTYFEFYLMNSLCDLTTGTCPSFLPEIGLPTYQIVEYWQTNGTENGTFNESFHQWVSFPLSAPLTRGEAYSSTLTIWVRCYSYAKPGVASSSISMFSLSSGGSLATLRAVTVKQVK
jgi:hypothetical protein